MLVVADSSPLHYLILIQPITIHLSDELLQSLLKPDPDSA